MNLNYDNTPESLLALIATADKSIESHSLAIDYDGEVIIDPEVHYPHVSTSRYKFCTHIKDVSLHNIDMIQALYKSLMRIFEIDMVYMDNQSSMSIAA